MIQTFLKSAIFATGLTLSLISGAARAAVMEYTSQAAFQLATGLTQNGFTSFTNTTLPNPFTLGSITIGNPNGTIVGYNDNEYGDGVQYAGIVSDSLAAATANAMSGSGVTAVGFTLGTFDDADVVNITVNGQFQTPLVTASGHPSTMFLGFTSTDPITSLTLDATNSIELDVIDYSYQPALSTVPLPSSAPMFGAALLAFGVVGYGLKRKGAASA